MDNLKDISKKEIPLFREAGEKFVNNEMSVQDFKGKSGRMGVYAQRGGKTFMIRLRIPAGIMSVSQLKWLQTLIEKYELEQLHLTTRQAIQLHDLSIQEVCDIMEEAVEQGIYTMGAGGNFPRNVAISPLSGVEKEEAFDVTPYALLVNNHFMKKIWTYKLPRKLKVSFSNSSQDHAHSTIVDLGFLATQQQGKPYFKVYLGGGLGKNPTKGVLLDEYSAPEDVLYHVEAITNLFIAEGDYENKNKARTRYIVNRMGEEAFIACYKKHLQEAKKDKQLTMNVAHTHVEKIGQSINQSHPCLIAQKQEGLYTVLIHPTNGQLTRKDLEILLEHLSNWDNIELRLAMSESMYIRNLTGEEAQILLEATRPMRSETQLSQSISCIGVPTCQIGIGQSQKLLKAILAYFEEKGFNQDVLPQLHISGCGNSCARHQIGLIGFAGKKKRVNDVVQDAFELHIGGKVGEHITKLGEIRGDLLAEAIPAFLYELAQDALQYALSFEDYLALKKESFEIILEKYLI